MPRVLSQDIRDRFVPYITTGHSALRGTAETLVYGFFNGLTALSAELEGRHYGGGVLELVPSEIEKLLLPDTNALEPNVEQLDRMVREDSVADTLEAQSEALLRALSKSEQMDLLTA